VLGFRERINRMLKHIVIFKWREDVTDADVSAVLAQLRALPAVIDALENYLAAPDLGLTEGTGDFAVVATVASPEALRSYLDHPQHVEVVKRLREMAETRTAVQVSDD
jgi:Stress responsive A/B Barrel Domain